MGKNAKATKRFIQSGQLKKTIQARHKHKALKKQIERRKGKKPVGAHDAEDEEDEEVQQEVASKKGKKKMTVDDILNADFMLGADSEEDEGGDEGEGMSDAELEEEEDAFDDDASFGSVDDLDDLEDDDDAGEHLAQLAQLAEKDPEFYKFLQENDKELLNFNADELAQTMDDDDDEGDEDADVDMDEEKVPVLTKEILQKWQKALLAQRSLRALRKLLIAFRSAAHMNEEDQVLAWTINSSAVYNKLLVTSFKYTPVVLEHHIPHKTQSNGKFKPPTQNAKFKTLQKLILSYFNNIIHLIPQITDEEMLRLALTESAKLVPYIVSSRKTVKQYMKTCLNLWSTANDSVRVTAFLSVRKLASSPDESVMDLILKSTYLTLIRSSKSTSTHTLPSINLMKNSASEVFCIDHALSYQHAFGYIRQLAIHLRNSMKIKSKEAYKQVYNWQFAHCVDFWCLVLARACDIKSEVEAGKQSDLRPLIYPLVQVSLGAIKLVPNGRSYPFHLHILRSLLHLSRHTDTYIPLSTCLVPILTSALTPSGKPKSSTLKALDFETAIRVPQQYVKTRVYSEGLVEEACFLLAEWLASPAVHGSIGFPEIVVPVVVLLKKSLKASANAKAGLAKEQSQVKTLLERVEDSATWMEQKRRDVMFAPGQLSHVAEWEGKLRPSIEVGEGSNKAETPLAKYVRVQRKAREKRRKLLEKARKDSKHTRVIEFYNKVHKVIRAEDPDHIIFFDGNTFASDFSHFGDAHKNWGNTAYSIHDYSLFGFPNPPEQYTGTDEQKHRLKRSYQKKRAWMDERGLCVWNGEWGPVYARKQYEGEKTDEINALRYKVLEDQLKLYDQDRLSWSIWLYKDIGFQGMTFVSLETKYMKLFEKFLAKKHRLAIDAWGADDTQVRHVYQPLIDHILEQVPVENRDIYPAPVWKVQDRIARLSRNILVSEYLVKEWAEHFVGLSEQEIDEVAQSFKFDNCLKREGLNKVLMENAP